MSINIVALAGKLAYDPAVKRNPGKEPQSRIYVVTVERKDDDSEPSGFKEYETIVPVYFFGEATALTLEGEYRAGDMICVEGEDRQQRWTTKNPETQEEEPKLLRYVHGIRFGRSLNMVVMKGQLGEDPSIKYKPSGGAETTISLATDVWDVAKQERVTMWAKVHFVISRKAELVADKFRKGAAIAVIGKWSRRTWVDEATEEKREYSSITAFDFDFVGGGKREGGNRPVGDDDDPFESTAKPKSKPEPKPKDKPSSSPAPDLDDEIPF